MGSGMRRGALVAVAFLAAGCDAFSRTDEAICAPPSGPPGALRAVAPEQLELTNECVWFWAYRLAPAEGSIADVADAVIGACFSNIEHYEALIARGANRPPDAAAAAAAFRRDAMYRVAEARAGNCPSG